MRSAFSPKFIGITGVRRTFAIFDESEEAS
jgi:hypothetical protein